jgi:hypothetical protein
MHVSRLALLGHVRINHVGGGGKLIRNTPSLGERDDGVDAFGLAYSGEQCLRGSLIAIPTARLAAPMGTRSEPMMLID